MLKKVALLTDMDINKNTTKFYCTISLELWILTFVIEDKVQIFAVWNHDQSAKGSLILQIKNRINLK